MPLRKSHRGGAPGGDGMGDGVRRPARCMRSRISPDPGQSLGSLLGSRFMLPGYACARAFGIVTPDHAAPGVPSPEYAEGS